MTSPVSDRRDQILIAGAGVVGCIGGLAIADRLLRIGGKEALSCNKAPRFAVMDRGTLNASYLSHPSIYEGLPGEAKASALARRLRERGFEARAYHGNLSRWPDELFEASVALVGLDRVSARLVASRRLRQSGTPSLVVGLEEQVGVQALGSRPEDACILCSNPDSIPLENTPCVPDAPVVSTREQVRPAAVRLLARIIGDLALGARSGEGLGRFYGFDPQHGNTVARLPRSPECMEDHREARPTLPSCSIPLDHTLAQVFTTARSELAAHDDPGQTLTIEQACFRLDYRCPACGARHRDGSRLTRSWPDRERCPCGSPDVSPTVRLVSIDEEGARGAGLLSRTISHLGTPPGGGFLVVGRRSSLPCRVQATGARIVRGAPS